MNPSSQYQLNRSQKGYFKSIIISIFLSIIPFLLSCTDSVIDTTENSEFTQFDKSDIEIPAVSGLDIIKKEGYSLQYCELHEQPLWVAYLLTCAEVYCTTSRTDDFRSDSLILSGSATNEDYENSGYVRGHIKPAADSRFSVEEMSASFLLSNISPMKWSFNEGIWLNLEKRIRDWAVLYDSLFIISGPILSDSLNKIGLNNVSIPKYFYKAVIEVTGAEHRGIAFIIPQETSDSDFMDYAITIDSLESRLQVDLFHNLPDSLEVILESRNVF